MTFAAGAVLALPDALVSRQQHGRGDDLHAGATPSTAVLTSVAVGPHPAGSILHDVLEYVWAEYLAASSANRTVASFGADAVVAS